ncbi:hypothetical protein MAR_025465 [Mya arenaria]|uniref:Uncharacterized protein n=1 Tax=Mya arenaria TaxID=6604 RepID=A0ABY7EMR2_MYAAR|nr:hypothetical protein MAR_025465 [Mya arenaria]
MGGYSSTEEQTPVTSMTDDEAQSEHEPDYTTKGQHRSKVVLVMFHKTAGSKTPVEVYMYTFKHAEVARELHVPFKLNS